MGSKCCKCSTDKGITSSSSAGSCPRSRVWEEGRELYFMEGETEWARAEGPPLLSRRLTDQAVKVGTRTRLLVEIASSSPLTVVWLHDGKKVEESERMKLVNEGNFYCVDISPVTLEDEGIWTCQGHNARGLVTSQAKLTLVVPRAYKKPEFVEPLRAVLGSAGTVSLETKVVGVPTPTLKWYKEDEEIKPGDVLGLTPDPLDPSLGTYTCIATNCMGSTVSTSRVHVVSPLQPKQDLGLSTSGPKPIFAKELRNEKLKVGTSLLLDCQVKVPPWPDRVSWYNSIGEVKEGPRAHLMEDGMGGYSIRVSPVQASDDGTWRFVATNRGGATSVTTCSISVSYPKNYRKPKFLDSLKAVLTEEGLVSFECKVVGYPTPQLSWFKDGQELKPGDVYQLTGTNSLGSYCCIARNCMGEAESTAVLTVEDIQSQLTEEERLQLFSDKMPPKFIQGLKSCEAKISDPFSFSVKVSVSPEPTILWFRDDEHIDESEPRYTLEKDKLGLFSLHISRLEFADQAEWKCVAMNDFGQSVTSSYLKLNIPRHYKKPKFLEELRAVLSDEGAVNLECKVIGVPQPVLKWFKDGKELKPGDIHRIISGQDGSCCLGTYTCMAQNCMGTVSSSASLLGFQEKGIVGSSSNTKAPEKTNTCVRDTSLSTIQEERTSQLHDTDKSLTLDDRPEEVSFSFDGREVSVSLYETPDLTEEEALQIVEMYADQISEHVSEHNVAELPPMRFTKESSTSGKLFMEAMVIDVSPDYFTPAEIDDLRTDADLEEFSLVEEAMVTPEEEKADIEFPSSPTKQEEMFQFPGRKLSQTSTKEEKTKRKKRKSTDSDKEDDSLQEFERRKIEKRPFKERRRTESEMEDDSLYEFESRKAIGQNGSKSVENKNEKTVNVSETGGEVIESRERLSIFKTAELTSPGHSRQSITEDDKTYNTAEESVFEKSEMSVLESLAQSLHEIQRGLAFVEAKVISESQQLQSPEISVLESLALPIAEVQRSLEVMEEKLDEALIGSQVLETLVQPISEFKKSLKMIEEEQALKRRASSIMESLARPLQELEREIASIQEQYYPQRQLSSEERYAKSVEEVQETLTRIIERQESVPHDRKLMKTISVELQELEETANDDLEQYYDRLLACSTELRKKLNNEHDQEIVDILRSMGDLVKPLKRLSAVTSKCISVIVKDYELGGMPSAKLVESLVKPLEALKSSLDLLESVSNLKSHRAIRGVGIPLLYKMSVPMEELQTTIKLVENLSAHTAVEFLVAPLENLIKVVSTIDISSGGEGFLENLSKEGPDLVKSIDSSLNVMMCSMSSIKSNAHNVESERELIEKLPNIAKPIEDLQRSLRPIQENIGEDLSYDEVCEVAQNLSKPLESLRSELSILQHEIEIEHYGDITGEKKSVLSELIDPLEEVQNSIKCFHESILCKEDPIHLRFVLYALKEMTEPFDMLCSKIIKTEEAILQGNILDPYQGLKNVTKAVRELRETSTLTKEDLPTIYGISSTLSKPLDLVENGLSDILFEVYNNDKCDLSINMLKKLAEPFMVLQSALLDIDSQTLIHENELPELKQAIQELQRSVLMIQDHVSFEYGDEPSTTESNIIMLESLVQPLQTLRSHISEIQRASVRTLIKTDRVLTDIRDVAKDITTSINASEEGSGPLSALLKKLAKTVEELGTAADNENIHIGQGQMLEKARLNMTSILTETATSLEEVFMQANELNARLEADKRKTLILIQDMTADLKSAVETAVEVMDERKVGIEQNIATASALEQVKSAMSDFSHSFSSMDETELKPPKKSISMDELKDFVVQLESDVNLVIDKISSTVDKNIAHPILDNILDDVKSVKQVVLKMIEERNFDENRIQYILDKVKFIENDLNELSLNTLKHEYVPLNEACKTAQAIVSMKEQLVPNSKEEYDQYEKVEIFEENVKILESIISKLKLESGGSLNDTIVTTIKQNLCALQENIIPLTTEAKGKDISTELLKTIKLPIKIVEESLHKLQMNKEDLNKALLALNTISNLCTAKDISTKSEFEKLFDSESLSKTIDVPLIQSIADQVESMRNTFKDIKDEKPVKLAWFIDLFEESLIQFAKELGDNVNDLSKPKVKQNVIEYVNRLKNEILDLRIVESDALNKLKNAVMILETAVIESPMQVLPAFQSLMKPLCTIHESVSNIKIENIKKAEFKYLDDYSKVSNDLEVGLMKLEKALITSEELDLQVMLKPIEILSGYVESISSDPLFEYADEDSSIIQLASLSEHITQIKTCLGKLLTTLTTNSGDQQKIEALLIDVAKPVRELQHSVALIQEQAMLLNVESRSSEFQDLKEAIAVVCSHVKEDESLRSLVNPAYVLKEMLETVTEENFHPADIASPVKEFKIALEEIESQTHSLTENSVKSNVTEPLLDLCHHVVEIIETRSTEGLEFHTPSISESVTYTSVEGALDHLVRAIPVTVETELYEGHEKTWQSKEDTFIKPIKEKTTSIKATSEYDKAEDLGIKDEEVKKQTNKREIVRHIPEDEAMLKPHGKIDKIIQHELNKDNEKDKLGIVGREADIAQAGINLGKIEEKMGGLKEKMVSLEIEDNEKEIKKKYKKEETNEQPLTTYSDKESDAGVAKEKGLNEMNIEIEVAEFNTKVENEKFECIEAKTKFENLKEEFEINNEQQEEMVKGNIISKRNEEKAKAGNKKCNEKAILAVETIDIKILRDTDVKESESNEIEGDQQQVLLSIHETKEDKHIDENEAVRKIKYKIGDEKDSTEGELKEENEKKEIYIEKTKTNRTKGNVEANEAIKEQTVSKDHKLLSIERTVSMDHKLNIVEVAKEPKENKDSVQEAKDKIEKLDEKEGKNEEITLKNDEGEDNEHFNFPSKAVKEEKEIKISQKEIETKNQDETNSGTKEDLTSELPPQTLKQEDVEQKQKEYSSIITEKLNKLNKYIKEIKNEITSSINYISKTKTKFSAQPILESLLIDIKSMERVLEKLLQDKKVDNTRLKFIADKAKFIEDDLKLVINDILKEKCPELEAARKTAQNIISLQLVEEGFGEKAEINIHVEDLKEAEFNIEKKGEKSAEKFQSRVKEITKVDDVTKQKTNETEIKDAEGKKNEMDERTDKKEGATQKATAEEEKYKVDSRSENELGVENRKNKIEIKKTTVKGTEDIKKEEEKKIEQEDERKSKKDKKSPQEVEENDKLSKNAVKNYEIEIKEEAEKSKKEAEGKSTEIECEINAKLQEVTSEMETPIIKKKEIEEKSRKYSEAIVKEKEEKIIEDEARNTKGNTAKQEAKERKKMGENEAQTEENNQVEENSTNNTYINKKEEAKSKIEKLEKVKLETENKIIEEKKTITESVVKQKLEKDEKVMKDTNFTKQEEGKEKREDKTNNKTEDKKEQNIEAQKDMLPEYKAKMGAAAIKEIKRGEKDMKESELGKKKDAEEVEQEAEAKTRKVDEGGIKSEIETKRKGGEDKGINEAAALKKMEEKSKKNIHIDKNDVKETVKQEVKTKNKKDDQAKQEVDIINEEIKQEHENIKKDTDIKEGEISETLKRETEMEGRKKNKENMKKERKDEVGVEEKAAVYKLKEEKPKEASQKNTIEEEEKIMLDTKNKQSVITGIVKDEAEAKKVIHEDELVEIGVIIKKKGDEVENVKGEGEVKNKKDLKEMPNTEVKKNENDKNEEPQKKLNHEEEKAKQVDESKRDNRDENKVNKEAIAKSEIKKDEKALEYSEIKTEGNDVIVKQETKEKRGTVEIDEPKERFEARNKNDVEDNAKMEVPEKNKKNDKEDSKILKGVITKLGEEKEAEAETKKGDNEKTIKEKETKKITDQEKQFKIGTATNEKMEDEKSINQANTAQEKRKEEENIKKGPEEKQKRDKEEIPKIEIEKKSKENQNEKNKKEAEDEELKNIMTKHEPAAKITKEKEKTVQEDEVKKEEEEKDRKEAEVKKRRDEKEKVKKDAKVKNNEVEEETDKQETGARKKKEEEEKIKHESEVKRKKCEEEMAKKEAEAKNKKDEEEKAKNEAEAKKKKDEEEKARKEVEAKKKKDEEENAKKEAVTKKKDEDEKAKKEAVTKKKDEEEKAKKEAVTKKKDEEEKAMKEAITKKQDEEEKATKEAVAKKKKDEEENIKKEAEEKKKKDEKEKATKEAVAKKKKDEEEKARKEAEEKKKKDEEEKATKEAVVKKMKDEEEKARKEAEEKKKDEEETAKKEAEAKKKKDEEEKARKEAEEKKKKGEEEKATKEAVAKKKKEEEEKARKEAEEKKKDKEETAKKEAEAKKKKDEEEKARKEAEEKKKKGEEEKATKEAVAKKKKEEEEKARKEAEEKKKKDEEEKATKEAVAKKKKDEEEKARKEAEEKKKDEEETAKKEAEAKKKKDEEEKARKEAEEKKKKGEEEKATKEAVAKKKKEEEEKARKEAERKKKKDEEEKATKEAEAKKKKDEEEKVRKEAEEKKKDEEEKATKEAVAKKKKDEGEKARKEAEVKKKKDEEEKATKEAVAKKKKDEEEKAKKDAEEKMMKDEEEKAKKVAEKKKKDGEETARKEAEEKKKKDEEEKATKDAVAIKKKHEEEKAKKEAEEKIKKYEEEKAKKEAEEKNKKDEEEKARKEAEEKKKKDEEEKATKDAVAKKKKHEEEKAKKEAEEKIKKVEEEKAKKEAEEKKKKDEEEKAKKEAEAKKKKDEEEMAIKEAEEKMKKDEEEKAEREAEKKKKKDEEEKAKKEAEEKKKKDEEEKATKEAVAKKKKDEEEKTRKEAEEKNVKDKEEKATKEAVAKKKKDEEEKARKEAEEKEKKNEEEKAKNGAEEKKKKDEGEKARKEAEEKEKKNEEEKAKNAAEEKKKKDEEETAKKEAEAKKKKDEEEKRQQEAEAKKEGEEEMAMDKVVEEEKTKKETELKKKKGEKSIKKEAATVKRKEREVEGLNETDLKKNVEVQLEKVGESKSKHEDEENTKQIFESTIIKGGEIHKENVSADSDITLNEKYGKIDEMENIREMKEEPVLNARSKDSIEFVVGDNKSVKESKLDMKEESKLMVNKLRKPKHVDGNIMSGVDHKEKNSIEVVELDQNDSAFWVGKGSSGRTVVHKDYEGDTDSVIDESVFRPILNQPSESSYSDNIKSFVQSSPSSRKYMVDGNINTDTLKTPKHLSRSPSYDISSSSYIIQSKMKQYLSHSGIDINHDYSPRGYPVQEAYSKKDFSSIHSSKQTDFLLKDYSHDSGSPILDSLRKKIDKSWKNLNRHMSYEYLTGDHEMALKEFGGSADQLSKETNKEFFYIPFKEDFSPLAQSRRYTRRRSASPLPILSDATRLVRQRSTSRSRYEYHERQPYICSPLRDRRVEHGANVKLTCNIGGEPEPTVEWRKDGQPIESIINRFTMGYNFGVASLEIKSVIASDAGQYTCVAINSAGQAATTATLRINTEHWQGMDEYSLTQEISLPLRIPDHSPRITGLIADPLVPSGGLIALHLQIHGCPRAEVTWMREGVPLKCSPRMHTLIDISMGLHTFLVEGATISEGGLYHCKVLSGASRLLEPAPAHIQVVERRPGDKPALITARPDTRITLTCGEDLTLTCYISGEPKPRVMLMKGIKDITDGDRTLKESFGEYVRLTLKRALPEDSGTYFIVARNPYGTDRAFSTVKVSIQIGLPPVTNSPTELFETVPNLVLPY